jgi:hypothetical protein
MVRSVAWIAMAFAIGCSKKTESEAIPPLASVSAAVSPRAPKPNIDNPCPETFADELPTCNGALVTKLDKYTWNVNAAGTWDVTVTQPDPQRGFRAVLIVWKDPDETIKQDDVASFGTPAHVTVSLQPGTYHISVINGSRGSDPQMTFFYALAITRGK